MSRVADEQTQDGGQGDVTARATARDPDSADLMYAFDYDSDGTHDTGWLAEGIAQRVVNGDIPEDLKGKQVFSLDIAALIATAQISISLVAPIRELWANSANKVFDAFAAGTTVGVNHGGWLADLLRESGAGHVLPHDDDAAAGRKLVQIVRDQRALADSERAARQLAATMFDSEVAADALERILQNAVSM